MEQSATRPPPSRNGVALPYLRPLTPEGKWTCPSAVCQLPGLCGKMDPPARRRVGSWCLTRPLLRVRLCPGRQENQHPERPVSSSPTHIPSATMGLAEDPGTLLVASGTARILRNPRAHALPDIGRQPDQPAPGPAAASSFSHVMSRPHLAFQYPTFAFGIPTGRGLVTSLAPSALARPSFPVSTLVSASAMGFPPLPGRFLPARFSRNLVGLVRWASQVSPFPAAGPSEGRCVVSSHNLLQMPFLPRILTRRHDP